MKMLVTGDTSPLKGDANWRDAIKDDAHALIRNRKNPEVYGEWKVFKKNLKWVFWVAFNWKIISAIPPLKDLRQVFSADSADFL